MSMSWNLILFKGTKYPDTEEPDKFITHLQKIQVKELLVVVKVGVVPVLDFEFSSLDTLYGLLEQYHNFHGLIFTSPRCVESVHRAVLLSEEATTAWNNSLKVNWASKQIFCVGPSTLEKALDLFMIPKEKAPPNFISSTLGNSDDLARVILEESKRWPIKLPLLNPCGNLKTDGMGNILTSGGVPIHSVTTYSTLPNPDLGETLKSIESSTLFSSSSSLGCESRTIYVFFSPSGIKFSTPYLSDIHKKILIAIGPTTRVALEKLPGIDPLNIHQCQNPTPEALTELITTILSKKKTEPSL